MSRAPFRPDPHRDRIVVLSGAGLSARAGLGVFRGEDGLWSRHPEVQDAMEASRLPQSLPLLWELWGGLARTAIEHGPTPGHLAIARMGTRVITQNVDGLHQAAGSSEVAELHGSALRAVCLGPDCSWSAPLTPGDGERAEDHGVPARCPRCGAPSRPDVVLFDEMLPEQELDRGLRWSQDCDVFVAVGTSGAVAPAAMLAPRARHHGAVSVLIDIDPPAEAYLSGDFDHVIARDAHEVLPEWERGGRAGGAADFLDPFARA